MPESTFQPFQTTEQDATNVAPQVPEEPADPRQEAIDQAHWDAGTTVAADTGKGAIKGAVIGGATGGPAGAARGALTSGGKALAMSAVKNCWLTCHNQSPPNEPPVPEIETEEEEKKKDEGN